jgi:hypothetical protein
VRLRPDPAAARVDVLVDGRPFTAYRFEPSLKKPVLHPLLTAQGSPVTRGFPLDTQPGERVDHPHQVGLWLNYGDVDGVDFWNNSEARSPQESGRMGTVVHRETVRAEGGEGLGRLEVRAEWRMPDARTALDERTVFVFRAEAEARLIDRTTTLTAVDRRVVFGDNKEGLLGLRVARSLEHPSGAYRSSEGVTGEAVWGTRGRWLSLAGRIGEEDVTLTVFDHPRNPNHPTFWHARGYGLFAANPLAGRAFAPGEPERRLTLDPGRSVGFRYRVAIRSRAVPPREIEQDYERYLRDEP